MALLTYLPILVGIVLFAVTFIVLRSRGSKTTETGSPSKTKTSNVSSPTKIDLPKPIYGPLHVFFGSQTGAAHNYAKLLADEAQKHGFDAKVVDLADFDSEAFKNTKIALFTMATHGEGEPTENAKKFYEYIISPDRSTEEFKGVRFSVFGLGNKQYQFYNAMGKRTNEHLARLGAERVYKYGEGDDNENLEDDFNAWKEGIWPELVKQAQAMGGAEAQKTFDVKAAENQKALPFKVKFSPDLKELDLENYDHSTDTKEYDFQPKQYLAVSASAQISSIKELRQKVHDGSTLHVEIDLKSTGLTYKTAQNLYLYPENNPAVVEQTAKLLGLNLDDVFTIEPRADKFKHPIPSPLSVRTYLTKFCDLQSTLRKKQLKDLAEFCTKEENKNKLLFLASNEGKPEYEVQIHSRKKGLLDLLVDYEVKLNLDHLIQISSVIMPRAYTIASSSRKSPDAVHLCVSMNVDALPDGKTKVGLTSDFLARQYKLSQQGKGLCKVRINVKESSFVLPSDPKVPIIMVGPGAGVAPFIGFVGDKAILATDPNNNVYGDMCLYFGCRGQDWDHLYREELAQFHTEKLLKSYYTAYSRAQAQKFYVQDFIERNKEEVANTLFGENGVLYICGATAMGKAVITKLADIAASYYKIGVKEAQEKVDQLEKDKKIIKELWG